MSKQYKNRIIEHREIPAELIRNNPKNWRLHPTEQKEALTGVLDSVGIVSEVMVRPLADGTFELIDGQMRRDIMKGQLIPSAVTDLSEEEADLILTTHDPITGMARVDKVKLEELLDSLTPTNQALSDLFDSIATMARIEDSPDRPSPRDEMGESDEGTKTICQYTMVFDDDEQLSDWFGFLRYLKDNFPEYDSIGSRLTAHIRSIREEESSE